MAYELHIERETGPIGLDEWKSAILQSSDVRLRSGDHLITNPKTGEVISFPVRDGDAEVYFPKDHAWNASLRWFEGKASFRAIQNTSHPVWKAAAALAELLGATIRGDGGEVYDLKTGKVA